jgi:hypothetical protein
MSVMSLIRDSKTAPARLIALNGRRKKRLPFPAESRARTFTAFGAPRKSLRAARARLTVKCGGADTGGAAPLGKSAALKRLQ